jgi:hypothetical protein
MENDLLHQSIHGVGRNPYGPLGQFMYGTPGWFKALLISEYGRVGNERRGEGQNDCRCISFPALCFNQGVAEVVRDEDALTTTNKLALKSHGWYDGLLIVDVNGQSIRVKSARKLHGVGLFFGYSFFVAQRIKVELVFDGEPFSMTVDDVRKRVLESFHKWHGWQTRGDFEELKAAVEKASTVADLIRLVRS